MEHLANNEGHALSVKEERKLAAHTAPCRLASFPGHSPTLGGGGGVAWELQYSHIYYYIHPTMLLYCALHMVSHDLQPP